MTPEKTNRAMRVYLGMSEGGGIMPYGEKERLVAEYGRVRAWAIARTLERYLEAMMSMPVDWDKDTLDSATDRATAFAEELVPGLEPLTYTGMGNYFAYSWR